MPLGVCRWALATLATFSVLAGATPARDALAGDLAALERDISAAKLGMDKAVSDSTASPGTSTAAGALLATRDDELTAATQAPRVAATRALVASCAAAKAHAREATVPARALRIKIHEVYRSANGGQVSIALPIRTCRYHISARGDKLVVRSRIYVDYSPDNDRELLQPKLMESLGRMVSWFERFGIVLDLDFVHDQSLSGSLSADCSIGFRDDGTRGITYNYKNWALRLDGGDKFSERERAWTFCHELMHYTAGVQEEYTISGASSENNHWPKDSIMRSHYDGSYPGGTFPILYPNHFRRLFAGFCPNAEQALPGINTDVEEMGRSAVRTATDIKDSAHKKFNGAVSTVRSGINGAADSARDTWDNLTACHCSGESLGDYKPTLWTKCSDWDHSGSGDWCYTKGPCSSGSKSKQYNVWYKFC